MDGVGRLFPGMGFLNVSILLVIGLSTLMLFRIFYVIYQSSKPLYSRQPGPLSAMIVLGSGGHTAEMLNLLAVLQMERFKPRYYIAASTDNMSLQKACVLENSFLDELNESAYGKKSFALDMKKDLHSSFWQLNLHMERSQTRNGVDEGN